VPGVLRKGIHIIVNRWVVVLLSLMMLVPNHQAWAARDIHAEIDQVRQERARLAQVRKSLNQELGVLGKDLHTLDLALLAASKAFDDANKQWKIADAKVQGLEQKQKQLKATIKTLQKHMQKEADAAWRRANRQPSLLDILTGEDVTEIPHRQFMLRYMLQEQQKERQQWLGALEELRLLEKKLVLEQAHLAHLRDEKKALQRTASARLKAKQAMARKLRHDVRLKQQRDKALAKQEKALFQLLDGLSNALLSSDKRVQHASVRQLKGKLSWPIQGRIVAKFGSKASYQRSKLRGVRIAPSAKNDRAKQVKAMAVGQVRYADWFGGFGLMMIVEYGDGVMAIYAHNDALYKQLGDWVEPGEVLAEAGSTGWIEKTRLYFELRDKGVAVNPARWCR